MSYILEALKKSEQERERERGALPDIKSIHTPSASTVNESRAWWPFLLIFGVVAISAGGVFYYLSESKEEQSGARLAQPSENKNSQSTVKKSIGNEKESITQVPRTAISPETTRTATPERRTDPLPKQQKSKVIFSKERLRRDDNVIGNFAEQQEEANIRTLGQNKEQNKKIIAKQPALSISDIPDNVRKKIPSIAFEGHVYSSVPERRSVMINGRKMREGEAIGDELMLKEITTLGAEFEYEGYRFRLNALQDWSFN